MGQIPDALDEYKLANELATFGRLLPDGVMLRRKEAKAGVDKSWALATFVRKKAALAAVGQGRLATGNHVLLIKQSNTSTELAKADTRGLSGVTAELEKNIYEHLQTVKVIEQRGGGLLNGSGVEKVEGGGSLRRHRAIEPKANSHAKGHKPRSKTHHSHSHGHHQEHRSHGRRSSAEEVVGRAVHRHRRHSKQDGGVKENEERSTLALSQEEEGATTRLTAQEPGAPSARKSKTCVVS